MLILDNIVFELQKAGGVSLVWRSILDSCLKDKINLSILDSGKCKNNIFYPNIKTELLLKDDMPLFIRRYKDVDKKLPATVFHSSYFRIHANKKVKNIVTVHDFVYEKYDHGIRKWVHLYQKKRALKAATAIICVSENTKQDLLKYHPWLADTEIRVIYNGVSDDFFELDDHTPNAGSPYILYVGGRNAHKNFSSALALLNTSTAQNLKLNLLVVGGGGFTDDEQHKIDEMNLSNRVKHCGHVDNSKLNKLYNSAFAFIYPSFYEGFGIPPLEAMAAGCPVICSNVSSIPEVVGVAGLLFDPNQPLTAEKYLIDLQNINFRSEVIRKGLKRAKLFSWEKTGEETLKLYKELLQ